MAGWVSSWVINMPRAVCFHGWDPCRRPDRPGVTGRLTAADLAVIGHGHGGFGCSSGPVLGAQRIVVQPRRPSYAGPAWPQPRSALAVAGER